MLNFYIPDWLYERLPLLYAAAGLCAMLFLQGGFAKFSGLVLCATAALVWSQRRQYRAREQKRLQFQRRQRRRHTNNTQWV
ncbi:hypothetical protein [Rubrivivax sp. A210]|uniref:hypothetical protein n=1 Tax=Rubrivivax sp. A210 TaxID=2772301 RepID=UPI001919A13D|nr:hypothetical protein [Rubrivivax sp. A210]